MITLTIKYWSVDVDLNRDDSVKMLWGASI